MNWRHGLLLVIIAAECICSPLAVAEDSLSFNRKGMTELNCDRPDMAAEFFLKAISADPGKKHYYNNLAVAYMRMGEYLKAEEQLKMSLQLDGNYARALSNMSVTLFHLGRYGESYRYYFLSMKSDSKYTEKRFEKGRVASFIDKLSAAKPGDYRLKKIKEYFESETEK